jgi:hypothetical protein
VQEILDWLVEGAVGPAVVALPIAWAASAWADAARRWFERSRRSDALSLLVESAAEGAAPLSHSEFRAVRSLLERAGTWDVAAGGMPEDLMNLIAGQLPERSAQERLAVSRAIAAAVLDFAVHELEPELYGEAQPARLARAAVGEAGPLGRVLIIVAGLVGNMSEVLDRLPPGPGGIAEVTAYLTALEEELDSDPWPQDEGFGGWPALVPSQIERKLEISTRPAGRASGHQVRDADELVGQCPRLAVLGGPGAGKTWLAKRAARRSAREALARLAGGVSLDEVELPLFTTCEDLAGTERCDTLVSAVARSALGSAPGVGGVRTVMSLLALFEARQGPVVIILDSLDEGPGAVAPIRKLAKAAPAAWRIIVTSRPGTWNQRAPFSDTDPALVKGTLRPLRYPSDVEPFISQWYASDPAAGTRLIEQLRRRPALRAAATVPLILAFYCILGGDQEIPERRADLYRLVIDLLLTGRWRDREDDQDYDHDECRRLLREWAWSAARDEECSGVGAWLDAFPTKPVRDLGNNRALDHVATVIKRGVRKTQVPPLEQGYQVTRRFVHRTLQEHLVAEYIAALPADQAAEELLGHLWYDPDWQYAAPTALILHEHRDDVLMLMMRRLAIDGFRGGFAAFDGCREIRRFLATVARESAETDWSPEVADFILLARYELVSSPDVELVPASEWPRGCGMLADGLLDRLEAQLDDAPFNGLDRVVCALTRVGITPEQRDRFRALLGKCLAMNNPVVQRFLFGFLAAVFSALEPSAAERAAVRSLMLERLVSGPYAPVMVPGSVSVPLGLAPTAEERLEFTDELANLLQHAGRDYTGQVVDTMLSLGLDPDRKRQLREILITRLHVITPSDAADAWTTLAKLDAGPDDRSRLVQQLLDFLADRTRVCPPADVQQVLEMLAATPQEQAQACTTLLSTIRHEVSGGNTYYHEYELAQATYELEIADETLRAQIRDVLESRLLDAESPSSAWKLAEGLNLLKISPGETREVLTKLAAAFTGETDPARTQALAEAGITLCPQSSYTSDATQHDRFRRQALLAALCRCERWLETTRTTLPRDLEAAKLVDDIRKLAVTPEERARAHKMALAMLSHEDSQDGILHYVSALAELAATTGERTRTRRALIQALASGTESWAIQGIADTLFLLDITGPERAELKDILVRVYAQGPDKGQAESAARVVARLNPVLGDLHGTAEWPCKPTSDLLAAVRRHTPLPAWLAALPEIIAS